MHWDCLEELKKLWENSIDSIVTDPPYWLSFMWKKWDYDVPSLDIRKEALRVLKPWGHLLAFAWSRTYHRMAVNIEDAGFDIRDQIMWIYGSWFPKSHNIWKAVDKLQGNERKNAWVTIYPDWSRWRETAKHFWWNYLWWKSLNTKWNSPREWRGTALKPAHEPIVVARKPLSEKTVAKNVLKRGTGGINIDGSRVWSKITHTVGSWDTHNKWDSRENENWQFNKDIRKGKRENPPWRFPANIILEDCDEVKECFPKNAKSWKISKEYKQNMRFDVSKEWKGWYLNSDNCYWDEWSASRYFKRIKYCPKASKKERNKWLENMEWKYVARSNQAKAELKRWNTDFDLDDGAKHNKVKKLKNYHPTVKPIELMRYLVKLVTPAWWIVLDPFMWSWTTGIACKEEWFQFSGIEKDEWYFDIATNRILWECETLSFDL